jgi:hypothetical protein
MHGLGRAQPLHHADRHGEEAEIGANDRLRHQAHEPERAQHDNDHRRDSENGDGLRGDDPWHERALERADVDDAHGKHDAEQRAKDESQERRGDRHPAVIDEAPARGDGHIDDGPPQLAQHLVRRRQHGPLQGHGIGDELARAPTLSARALVAIEHVRGVEPDGAAVPQHDNRDDDREHRQRGSLRHGEARAGSCRGGADRVSRRHNCGRHEGRHARDERSRQTRRIRECRAYGRAEDGSRSRR